MAKQILNKDNSLISLAAFNKLQKKSEQIIGMFTRAIADLEVVNEEINAEIDIVGLEVQRLTHIETDLQEQKEKNQTFMENLKGLLP